MARTSRELSPFLRRALSAPSFGVECTLWNNHSVIGDKTKELFISTSGWGHCAGLALVLHGAQGGGKECLACSPDAQLCSGVPEHWVSWCFDPYDITWVPFLWRKKRKICRKTFCDSKSILEKFLRRRRNMPLWWISWASWAFITSLKSGNSFNCKR